MPGMCRTVAFALVGTVTTTSKYAKDLSGLIAFLVDVQRMSIHRRCVTFTEKIPTRHCLHFYIFRYISALLPVETFAKVSLQN